MSTADIINSQQDQILSNWMQSLKEKMPVISQYDKSAIENSVPNLLKAIVVNLKSDNQEEVNHNSQEHGQQRASFRNYSLRHIIREYNLLKITILHLLDEHELTPPKERDAIMLVIDQAIEQAAEIFYIVKQGVQVDARKVAEKKANDLELEDDNREEFIQSISHDLNSPLNNIKGCINLLEKDLDVGEVSQILRILKTSANQAEMLIKDFLDVGKIGTNEKVPVYISKFNILEELRNEINVYEVSQKVEIELQSEVDDLYVEIDLELFRRAFNNLMNNALKHGETESKITISCLLEENKLIISVQNYGKVIPDKVLQNIFNRYYQVDGTRKGWGIGLAFVKEVVKAHEGDVQVTSNKDQGTIFKLIFPQD
ncbi:hypothetical protein GCM10011506_19380 [Marivirga lumbricoides]|uniref:histidine kinase n=1 Tax=Marivirga lumbricoides TaxID=1046115 RepID=A0ABQ1M6P2_9BACT|nr:hypothetical protein GCM10011506_19380 [Marivirga lumbricoides]